MGKDRGVDEKDLVLFQFLAGDCDTTSLVALTGKSRRFDCEAYFMLGLDALADGRRTEAVKYFTTCEHTGYFAFYDYAWSRAFAERLESGKPWLEWIPNKSGTGTRGSNSVQKQE